MLNYINTINFILHAFQLSAKKVNKLNLIGKIDMVNLQKELTELKKGLMERKNMKLLM